jgi:hypothetical protein
LAALLDRQRALGRGIADAVALSYRRYCMGKPEQVRARITALNERVARLQAQKDRLLARASQAERKRDTRRKILIGGAVLAAIEHEGVPVLKSSNELLRWLDLRLTREHDRAAFDLPAERIAAENPLRP